MIKPFVARNWKVIALFLLVLGMLLLAPEQELKFIYTEF